MDLALAPCPLWVRLLPGVAMRVFTLMIVGLALATMPGCAGCKKEQPAKKAAPGEPAAADEPEAEKAPLAAPRTALELIPDNAAFAVAVPRPSSA